MVTKIATPADANTAVRDAIKCIRGRREIAEWHHGHVNGMISAFSLVGLLEKQNIKKLNTEADDALEKVTHANLPKLDI